MPFENLSIHLGEPITLDEGALFGKVVGRRRGGLCYELNGLFASLLSSLGYSVTLLACRGFGSDGLGPPFDHLALRVDAPEPWLVDVGFGRHSELPLRLNLRCPQPDLEGTFEIVETKDGDLDVRKDGRSQYRIEQRPRALDEFEPTCWWHQTSPKSHFTQSLVCSRMTETGRVTLSDRLLIETTGADRHEQLLTDEEVRPAYRAHFGIELDRSPSLAPR